MRVHELAKELGLSSKELISEIADVAKGITSHMSVLNDDQVRHIRARHAGPAAAAPPLRRLRREPGGRTRSRRACPAPRKRHRVKGPLVVREFAEMLGTETQPGDRRADGHERLCVDQREARPEDCPAAGREARRHPRAGKEKEAAAHRPRPRRPARPRPSRTTSPSRCGPGPRSSPSWVTWTTARPRCWTGSARRRWWTRSRGHHPAHRRLHGGAQGPAHHLSRYAGPRGVHRHARPRAPT